MMDLPRALRDFQPLPGHIKDDYTDFVVDELPLYPADGAGTHTFFLIEKAGLSTHQAVYDIAKALNVRRHEIGFAGLKDSRAVARQWMSIEHVDPERIQALSIPRLRILEVTRHRNKLRLGHLRGNHFIIKVRQTDLGRAAELQDAVRKLAEIGVPNYFGGQRFGYRGDTWAVGRAIVRGDLDEALDWILGHPMELDTGDVRRARQLYEARNYPEALRAWPRLFRTERAALKVLVQSGKRRRAFQAIDRSMRDFYVSAYQSRLFNRVVAERIPDGLGTLLVGDLAWLHANGAVFRVEDLEREQPRAAAFDISPTGPLYGYRMTQPEGRPGEQEAAVLAADELAPDAFHSPALRVKGSRRPLRFRAADAEARLGADEAGPYLELQFALPRGCYATALLRELFHLEGAGGGRLDAEETEVGSG